MKFRRNIKQEKVFKKAGISLLLFSTAFLIIYFVTQNTAFIRLFATGIFTSILVFYLVYTEKRAYIEFQKDKIVFINHIASNIEINISDIEAIIMPSVKALKSTWKDNDILFKQSSGYNPVSYTPDIEKFILRNLDIPIIYYDNYNDAINIKK